MGSLAGFHFAAYVAMLQAFHIATALLLWLFLRRLGLPPLPAALGFAFFALHVATLPAYWKPMYIFDVLCGFWVILALLLYQRNRFFLSLLCAWLAFKSKEMELMLPVVLLLYEWCFGREKNSGKLHWKPLVPFFLMSFSFGLQSTMLPGPGDPLHGSFDRREPVVGRGLLRRKAFVRSSIGTNPFDRPTSPKSARDHFWGHRFLDSDGDDVRIPGAAIRSVSLRAVADV